MNRLTILGVLACLLLTGLITAELLADIRASDALSANISQPAVTLPEAEPSGPGNSKAVADVIEARPLFSASRRPVGRNIPAPQVDMAVKPLNRRLTGIVVEPSIRAAVFAGDGNGRGIVVREGEPIDGWFLETVTPAGVTLRAAGASQVIELVKTRKGTEGQSATKPTVPSFIPPSLRQER